MPPTATLDLERVFTYHSPSLDQAGRYMVIRNMAKDFAAYVQSHTPPSREQSVALTNIQQAVMWANASIAINEQE